jgi:hypothetical protein
MELTFISWPRFITTVLVLAAIVVLYVRLVRPHIKDLPAVKGLRARLKARWDVACAVVVAVAPIAWNGVLDGAIAISLVMADALPAIAGLDLSAFVLSPATKTAIQVAAAALPAIRAAILAKRAV